MPKRDARALVEALRIRALALTGETWERNATRDMMKEAAQQLEDAGELSDMRLAAIMTASVANLPASSADRISPDHPYWTVALQDVYTAIDREIRERQRAEAAEQLWEAVGQHIDAAHIGFSHRQILAVFNENRELRAKLQNAIHQEEVFRSGSNQIEAPAGFERWLVMYRRGPNDPLGNHVVFMCPTCDQTPERGHAPDCPRNTSAPETSQT